MSTKKQLLGVGNNPDKYMELIDTPDSEGYLIRHHVIFPTLLPLIKKYCGTSDTPLIDFGSGTGSLTSLISRECTLHVRGVDVSRRFVNLARTHYPDIQFHSLKNSVAMGLNMHHAQAHLVFHCTSSPETLLDTIADTVEVNGYVFVTVPNPDYFKKSSTHSLADGRVVNLGDAKMTYYEYSLSEYERMFIKSGLSILCTRECFAGTTAPLILDKYKHDPHFIVYVLQKKLDIVDTVMITHSASGKLLLLTRSPNDDKFPGARSFFSARRTSPNISGPENLHSGLRSKLGISPEYISPNPVGSLQVKHIHNEKTQRALVRLYVAQISQNVPIIQNQFYTHSQFINPSQLRPCGGACTQLGYEFIRNHSLV